MRASKVWRVEESVRRPAVLVSRLATVFHMIHAQQDDALGQVFSLESDAAYLWFSESEGRSRRPVGRRRYLLSYDAAQSF